MNTLVGFDIDLPHLASFRCFLECACSAFQLNSYYCPWLSFARSFSHQVDHLLLYQKQAALIGFSALIRDA
jgi:hypothetical protein